MIPIESQYLKLLGFLLIILSLTWLLGLIFIKRKKIMETLGCKKKLFTVEIKVFLLDGQNLYAFYRDITEQEWELELARIRRNFSNDCTYQWEAGHLCDGLVANKKSIQGFHWLMTEKK